MHKQQDSRGAAFRGASVSSPSHVLDCRFGGWSGRTNTTSLSAQLLLSALHHPPLALSTCQQLVPPAHYASYTHYLRLVVVSMLVVLIL